MQNILSSFLCRYVNPEKPFLLALSGGPDSRCLLELLTLCKQKKEFSFAIAHVDHGWREESSSEAIALRVLAEKLGIDFHLKVLDPTNIQGNLEAACRKERLEFFKQLCRDYGYQAVMLGHHFDDQAETVFKKILEGVSMPYLSGLQEEAVYSDLTLWRPLLKVKKKHIIQWLEKQGIESFDDKTNQDTRYLRARFRHRIFPLLHKEFGKEISSALCTIASDSSELNHYLQEKIAPYLEHFYEGPFGVFLDLTNKVPQADLELKFLLRYFFKKCNFLFSAQILDTAITLIRTCAANKAICCGSSVVHIDRSCLFFQKKNFTWENTEPIKLGKQNYGIWSLKACLVDIEKDSFATDWRSAWQGECQVFLPYNENYFFAPASSNQAYPRSSSIAKWWNAFKVPAFFRKSLPVIYHGNTIIHEFLTGKQSLVFSKQHKVLKLLLKVNN